MGKSKGKGNRKSKGSLAGGGLRKLQKAKDGAPSPLKQIRLSDAGFAARLMGKYAWHAGAAGGRKAELHHRLAERGTSTMSVPLTLQLFLRHVQLNLHLLAEKMRTPALPAVILRQETRRERAPDHRPETVRVQAREVIRERALREPARPDASADVTPADPAAFAQPQAVARQPGNLGLRGVRLTHPAARSAESAWRLLETVLQYPAVIRPPGFLGLREVRLPHPAAARSAESARQLSETVLQYPAVVRPPGAPGLREVRLTHPAAGSAESAWRLLETVLQYQASVSVIRKIALFMGGRTAGTPVPGRSAPPAVAPSRRDTATAAPAQPASLLVAMLPARVAPSSLEAHVPPAPATYAYALWVPMLQVPGWRMSMPQVPAVARTERTHPLSLQTIGRLQTVHRLALAYFTPEQAKQIRLMERLRLVHVQQGSLLTEAAQTLARFGAMMPGQADITSRSGSREAAEGGRAASAALPVSVAPRTQHETAEEIRRVEWRRTSRVLADLSVLERTYETIRRAVPVRRLIMTDGSAQKLSPLSPKRMDAVTPLELIFSQLQRETISSPRQYLLQRNTGVGTEEFPMAGQDRMIRLLSSRSVLEHAEEFIRKAWQENRHISVTVRRAEQISQFVRKQLPFIIDFSGSKAARRLAPGQRAEMLLARPAAREGEAVLRLIRYYLSREAAAEPARGTALRRGRDTAAREPGRMIRQQTGREMGGGTASMFPQLSVSARTAETAWDGAGQPLQTASQTLRAARSSFLKAESIATTVRSALSLTVSAWRTLRRIVTWTDGATEDQGPAAKPAERAYLSVPRAVTMAHAAVMAERAGQQAVRLTELARRIAQRADLSANLAARQEAERPGGMAGRRSALTHRSGIAPEGAGEPAQSAALGLRSQASEAAGRAASMPAASALARPSPAPELPQPFRSAPRRASQVHVTRREAATPDAPPSSGQRAAQAMPQGRPESAAARDAGVIAAAIESALDGLQVPLAVRRSLRILQDVRLSRVTDRREQNLFIHRQIFRRLGSRTDIYNDLISDTRVFTPSPSQSASVPFVVARKPQPSVQPAPEVMIQQRPAAAARMEVAAKRTIAADYEPAIKALQTTIRKVEEDLNKVKTEWKEPRPPDIRKLTDEVYRALTSRIRFEQQRRGL